MNKFTLFTNHYLPILSYMVNTQIISSDSMVEIYPYLDEHKGEYAEDEKFTLDDLHDTESVQAMSYTLEQLADFNFMLNKMYTVDANISAEKNLFDVKYFMQSDQSINLKEDGPKVLIYHTHSQEAFIDSKPGVKSDTIVGVGDELTRILEEEYGIKVIHLNGEYDVIDGKLDRSQAYEKIEPALKDAIKKNPSIEVLIDVHRDGIPDNVKLVTEVNGKPTAKIMFFNGLSRIMKDGKMTGLASMPNKYVKENMAFSFQMHLQANAIYPGLTRKIYLKGYRYNLHLMPKSLLVEIGAQTNTVAEAKNAMEPLAEILYQVVQ
ncbi:MAG: stage II sporulation protein P [Firmicutes bacterium HGW-Firmicutes-1]|nr:MAG: stage II sporulation protein P [Firmicutes bacterium HGW-Firmicutes-1]